MIRQQNGRKVRLTGSQYVERRTGVPLGAGSFAGFWRHWNPIWTYDLGRYINSPLRRLPPGGPALAATFLVSGAIHDVAGIVVTGPFTFLFVRWIFALGLGVLLTSWVGLDYRSRAWAIRAGINVVLVLSGLVLALLVVRMFGTP